MLELVFLLVIENVFTTFFNKVLDHMYRRESPYMRIPKKPKAIVKKKVKSKTRKNNSTSKTINTAKLQEQKPWKFPVNESHHKNTSSSLSKLPSIAKETQRKEMDLLMSKINFVGIIRESII